MIGKALMIFVLINYSYKVRYIIITEINTSETIHVISCHHFTVVMPKSYKCFFTANTAHAMGLILRDHAAGYFF